MTTDSQRQEERASRSAIERVVAILDDPLTGKGGQSELARRLGTVRAAVNAWVRRGYVPAYLAIDVSRAVDGRVSVEELIRDAKLALTRSRGERGG